MESKDKASFIFVFLVFFLAIGGAVLAVFGIMLAFSLMNGVLCF